MSEKVIREIKIIETDDGFRIEMSGDKEELRKLLFEEGKPFFMPFGRGRSFGGFGHRHEPHEHRGHEHHHEHHGHEHHGHDPRVEHLREHLHHPFEGHEEPSPEDLRNQRFFFQRFGRRGGWKAKRGGYDMGPWWDEGAEPDDAPPVQL